MKTRSQWLVLALGIAALALAVLIASSAPVRAASGPSPVTVTNTPLPVAGAVTASQGGAWAVGISGEPTVKVARQPWRVNFDDGYGLEALLVRDLYV